jgi:transmembrane sensor
MNQDLLKKYLANSCSSTNVDSFFDWIKVDSNKVQVYNLFQNHWNKLTEEEIGRDTLLNNQRLDKIHHQINLRNKHTPFSKKRSLLVSLLSKAAIILLIPALTLFVYTTFFTQNISNTTTHKIVMNEIISPIGSRITLDLSDGTKVWLNHGSKLIYPQHFSGKTRKVKLSGEGYFDVAHNPEKPFVVETEDIQIVAMGTQFNVNAYTSDNILETTLESGKVILKSNSNESFEMKPGQHFNWNKKYNSAEILDVDTEKYLSWKDGKLIFEDDSFENIASRLSRWYNVDIEFNNPKIKELTYTATFIDEPLDQILEMLEIVSPIECNISKRTKLTDGTYSKKKILVSFKK